MKLSQNDRVLRRAREHGSVNPADFTAPTCDGLKPILRVAARILDLREDGYEFRGERKPNGTTTYFLTYDIERDGGSAARPPVTADMAAPSASAVSLGAVSHPGQGSQSALPTLFDTPPGFYDVEEAA